MHPVKRDTSIMSCFKTVVSAIALASLSLTTPTVAETAQPIVRVGKHCPSGYRSSGDYCVPRSGSSNTSHAIEKNGSCPPGYRKNGEYCIQRSGNEDTRHIIEKKGSCPSGYRKSGNYCIERS